MMFKRAKRSSTASRRQAALKGRVRMGLTFAAAMENADPALDRLATLARRYRPHVVSVTQDLSALEALSSK